MDYRELEKLQPGAVLEASTDPQKLCFKLQQILGTREAFAGHDIVTDGPVSIRIFFANPEQGGHAFNPPDSGRASNVAHELMILTESGQARYPHLTCTTKDSYEQGWELRSVMIKDRAAAVAYAAWI